MARKKLVTASVDLEDVHVEELIALEKKVVKQSLGVMVSEIYDEGFKIVIKKYKGNCSVSAFRKSADHGGVDVVVDGRGSTPVRALLSLHYKLAVLMDWSPDLYLQDEGTTEVAFG